MCEIAGTSSNRVFTRESKGWKPSPVSSLSRSAALDSDNDSVFINETLVGYCEESEIEFTRSRAYRKNDQA